MVNERRVPRSLTAPSVSSSASAGDLEVDIVSASVCGPPSSPPVEEEMAEAEGGVATESK